MDRDDDGEIRIDRRIERLRQAHINDLKRWAPILKRDFLLEIGAIDIHGNLTIEFGADPVDPIRRDGSGRLMWDFGDQ